MLRNRFAAIALAVLLAMPLAAPAAAAPPAKGSPELYQALQQGRAGVARAEVKLAEARAAYLDVPVARAGVALSLAKMSYDTASLLLLSLIHI